MTHDKLRDRIMRNTVCDPWSGCWIWMGTRNNGGYPTMSVRVEGEHMKVYAHRVSYEVFKKQPRRLTGREVAHHHHCISQLCCNPAHLRATTRLANERDKKHASRWKRLAFRSMPMATRTLLKRVGQLQEERC